MVRSTVPDLVRFIAIEFHCMVLKQAGSIVAYDGEASMAIGFVATLTGATRSGRRNKPDAGLMSGV